MQRIVFYSWQSDLPNASNRGLIQNALEAAAAAIAADDTVQIEPVVDRDTQGVPGAPDIASTIFAKITGADIVVADVSIVGRPEDGRPTPNPNVLIELGYALKALGHERVILVFNEAFGNIQELPFDLRMRRLVVYNMPAEVRERASGRRELQRKLDVAIRAGLGHVRPVSVGAPAVPAVSAIENGQPNRILVVRRNLAEILSRLVDLEPTKHSKGGTTEELLSSIETTQEPVAEFSRIAEVVGAMGDEDVAMEIYRWLGKILERYDLPAGHTGSYSNADFDYFKFIGHELFVTLVACLVGEQRWEMLNAILEEPIPIPYVRRRDGPQNVMWSYASTHMPSLIDESSRKGRVSVHADVLYARHTQGGLAAVMPFEGYVAADYLLFLVGELPEDQAGRLAWRAWSVLYMKHVPMFIRNAEKKSTASQLAKLFKLSGMEEFKRRLQERGGNIGRLFRNGWWDWPIETEDIARIGTR